MYVYIMKVFFFSLKPEGSGCRPTSAIYTVGILGQVVCILQAEVLMTHRVSPLCLPNPNTAWGVLFPYLFYRREEPGRVGQIRGPAKILTYPSLTPSLFSF